MKTSTPKTQKKTLTARSVKRPTGGIAVKTGVRAGRPGRVK